MSKPNNPGQITTLSSATTIVGDIQVDNDIRVAGTIKGKLTTTGHLIIEQTGLVEGEIKAGAATIAGKIVGNIETTDKLILEAKAVLQGDIRTKLLVIEDGANFNGNCSTESKAAQK
jgi:cytoskeletal protein CcmA (bactofilin family)